MIIQALQKRHNLFCLFILLLSSCFTSCVFEQYNEVASGDEPVTVTFSTRSFVQNGITISKFRIIAFNSSGSLEVNETINNLHTSANRLSLNIRPGTYTIFGIGNERPDMTESLQSAISEAEADRISMRSVENMDSTQLPIAWKKTVFIKEKSTGSKIGQISYNNQDWLDVLEMAMERMASKIEVFIRKESNADIAAAVRFVPKNIPVHSYLTAKAYEGEFTDTSVETNTEVTEAFVKIIDRIYPEHLASAENRNTSAELEVNINGTMKKVALPIGNLERNKIYRFEVLVTAKNIEVGNLIVSPWDEKEGNESVDGVEINFSRVEVPYSFGQESKVFFTTKNIPEGMVNLKFAPSYKGLNQASRFAKAELSYTYNQTAKQGHGSITIRRASRSMDYDTLIVNAAGLKKRIVVRGVDIAGSNIYFSDATKQLTFDDVPRGGRSPHDSYQGLFFFWGSLSAISPSPSYNDYSKGYIQWSSTGILNPKRRLPEGSIFSAGPPMEFAPDKGIGDICVYMTRRGTAPSGKKWRSAKRRELFGVDIPKTYKTPPATIFPLNGQGEISQGVHYRPHYFFPSSGLVNQYISYRNEFVVRSTLQWPTFSLDDRRSAGDVVFQSNMYNNMSYGEKEISSGYGPVGYPVRCVVDDTPGDVIPLYVISYGLSISNDATITVPTPDGIIRNQHADAGGSIKLSETVLTSSDGRVHNGWIINGKEYDLGAVISNIQSDMVAQPRWFGHVINGVVWASTNLKAPKEFAPRPGSTYVNNYFAWNNYLPGTGSESLPPYDPEREPCPDGWRTPVKRELEDLLASGYIVANNGFYFGLTSISGDETLSDYLFIPAAGYMNQYGQIIYKDWQLFLPSSDLDTSTNNSPCYVVHGNTTVGKLSFVKYARALRMPVRCVKK